MAGTADDKQPGDSPEAQPERAYDPNETSIWPVYPPGTRLPMADWSRRKAVLILLHLLAIMAGAGVLIWWFIATVTSR